MTLPKILVKSAGQEHALPEDKVQNMGAGLRAAPLQRSTVLLLFGLRQGIAESIRRSPNPAFSYDLACKRPWSFFIPSGFSYFAVISGQPWARLNLAHFGAVIALSRSISA